MNIVLYSIIGLLIFNLIFIALYCKTISDENEELGEELRRINVELDNIRAKQRAFEKRFINLSAKADRIEIVHTYDDSDAPKYGGF